MLPKGELQTATSGDLGAAVKNRLVRSFAVTRTRCKKRQMDNKPTSELRFRVQGVVEWVKDEGTRTSRGWVLLRPNLFVALHHLFCKNGYQNACGGSLLMATIRQYMVFYLEILLG